MGGFDSAMGAGAGGAEMLQEVLRRHMDEAYRNRELRLREADMQQRRELQADNLKRQTENDQYLREERQAQAALRNQQRSDRLTTSLAPGSTLDAGAVDALKSGDLGSLVRHEASQLPSTAIAGQLAAGGAGRPLRIVGLSQTANAGHDERDVYMGTAVQQQAQRQREQLQGLIDDPNTPEQVRNYLSVAAASPNKGSLPGTLFQSPDQPVYRLGADGVLRSVGSVPRGARVVNEPRPPAAGRLAPGADDPALPAGAQRYAIEIARKHGGDYNAALTEANDYLSTQDEHPHLSPKKFVTAIQSAMRKPGGSHGGSDEDLVNMATGGGAAPAPAPVPAPANRGIQDSARSIIQQKIGRKPTDDEVARFLSSPRNRQLLAQSGGQ